MFTVEQRDLLRDRVLQLAGEDDRVIAGAAVGSLAVGEGDRFSDLDLTFGIADEVTVVAVLADWTGTLVEQMAAVELVDLERGRTIYRVSLLPEALQFDLSMTPASQFRPAGPRFRLLFGETAAGEPETPPPAAELFIPTPPVAGDLFGWGIIYALHARSCIERRRMWQAEHYIGAVRDHALSLACLNRGLTAVQPAATTTCPLRPLLDSAQTHVSAIEPEALRAALIASVSTLMDEGAGRGSPQCQRRRAAHRRAWLTSAPIGAPRGPRFNASISHLR